MEHLAANAATDPIGVIGGSGLYDLPGLADARRESVETPYGSPSDAYSIGRLGSRPLVFLPRHGNGHRISPSEINYRANLYGFWKLGVRQLISVTAVGSMKEIIAPGDLVIVDQFIDLTKRRTSTFFDNGVAGHIPFADPICPAVAKVLYATAAEARFPVHKGGTYVCIEGPQFSTRAESLFYSSWGVDVIGMTNMPEAKLARELGICYAAIAMATDFDCWHAEEAAVSAEAVAKMMRQNVFRAKEVISATVSQLSHQSSHTRDCHCASAPKGAIMTDPAVMNDVMLQQRLSFAL